MTEVPTCEKLTLTIEEAAAYSGIGVNRLYKMTDEPSCPFVLYVGKKRRRIKRKEFEKFIEKAFEV